MNENKYLLFVSEMDMNLAYSLPRMGNAIADFVFGKANKSDIEREAINLTSLHIKIKNTKVPAKYKNAHTTLVEATSVLNEAVKETLKRIDNKAEFEELFYFQMTKYENLKEQALRKIMQVMDKAD